MKHWIGILLFVVLVSPLGVLTKVVGDGVPPLSINFLRVFLAFLTALVVCPRFDKGTFKMSGKDIALYAMIGFIFAVATASHTAAYLFAPIANVIVLVSTYFIPVYIFSAFFLKERAARSVVGAGLLALGGIAFINPLEAVNAIGNLLALVSSLAGAMLYVMMRYADRKHGLGDIMWMLLFASVFSFPFALVQGFGDVQSNLLWILLTGVVVTGFSHIALTYGLQKVDAELMSVATLVGVTFLSVILGVVFIGEAVSGNVIIGGAFVIIAGIIIETRTQLVRE